MAVDFLRPDMTHTMFNIKEETNMEESRAQNTIHSGHFMVSRVHDPANDGDSDEEGPALPYNDLSKGYDFLNAAKQTSTTYDFGFAKTAIDESLTKLFECMTLAYSGTITSPRWKQFRGLHVSQKQRIRLNNLIWREWHMQYIDQQTPIVCKFATPLSDDIHSKPEAVVLEGKYWKRRLDTVTAEYKKWRRYFKDQVQGQKWLQGVSLTAWYHDTSCLSEEQLLERLKDVTFIPCHKPGTSGAESGMMLGQSSTDLALLNSDMMDVDFTNDLFASLNQPFAFPNPRELNQLGFVADLIQPGLIQLQPDLEGFMDVDSVQDLLNSAKLPSSMFSSSMAPSLLPEHHSNLDINQGSMRNSDTLLDYLSSPATPAPPQSHIQLAEPQQQISPQQQHQLLHQLQQQHRPQRQQQHMPITQLSQLLAASDSQIANVEHEQSLRYHLNTALDNHNGNGGQQQSTPSILLGGGQDPHRYTSLNSSATNINNVVNSNINNLFRDSGMSQDRFQTNQQKLLNRDTKKSGPLSTSAISSTDILSQLLQQQQQQEQNRQLSLQQQKSRQAQLQPKPQHSLASKVSSQHELLQQCLQQTQLSSQGQQHTNINQSPSAQSPLLVKSLTSMLLPQTNMSNIAQKQTHPINIHRNISQQILNSPSDTTGVMQSSSQLSKPSGSAAISSPSAVQKRVVRSGRQAQRQHLLPSNGRSNDRGSSATASSVMTDLAKMAANTQKKDGHFAVPQGKPVNPPRKNRTIAPAPVPIAPNLPGLRQQQEQQTSPSSSSRDSYLERLLKNGTYTGAMVNMNNNISSELTRLQPIAPATSLLSKPPEVSVSNVRPICTTTNLYEQLQESLAQASSQNSVVHQLHQGVHGQIQSIDLLAGLNSNLVIPVSMEAMTPISPGDGKTQSPQSQQHQQVPAGFILGSDSPQASTSAQSPSNSLSTRMSPITYKLSPSPPPTCMDTTNSSFDDPTSPFGTMVDMSPLSALSCPGSPSSSDADNMSDPKKAAHLSAEQKRRWNLKTGFDMLQNLVPALAQNPRVSKATMLQKTAEFCKRLKEERQRIKKESAILHQEIESLNTAISQVQAQLPETGVPVTRQRKDQMRDMLDEYICMRTKENWKFWIFSVIMTSLYDSYCNSVSTSSMEELCRTSLTWLEQSCSLVTLRPHVLNALRKLSTSTSILTEPHRVQEQALQAVLKTEKKK